MTETGEACGVEIEHRIYLIRGHRVMLSTDLAGLYGVAPKVLVQAVKRNASRFPSDFAFVLSAQEVACSRSQFVTLNSNGRPPSRERSDRRGSNVKYPPYAFTEQGVAMLSSVLRSERAIQVNIAIMRAFVRLKETLSAHKDLALKLAELERKIEGNDQDIQTLFAAIRQLMAAPQENPKQIGFHVRERRAAYTCGPNPSTSPSARRWKKP